MEPTTQTPLPAKSPQPVMDVTPPAPGSRSAQTAAVVEAPQEIGTKGEEPADGAATHPSVAKPAPGTAVAKKTATPRPLHRSTGTGLAIACAMVVFAVLSGLAYMAYKKG